MTALRGTDPLADWVSRTIAVATAVSVGLVAVGVGWALLTGGVPETPTGGTDLFEQIGAGGAGGTIAIGLLLLVLTPIAQLAVSAAAFLRIGERRYALIVSGVLVLLAAGIVSVTVLADLTSASASGNTRTARGGVPLTGAIIIAARPLRAWWHRPVDVVGRDLRRPAKEVARCPNTSPG